MAIELTGFFKDSIIARAAPASSSLIPKCGSCGLFKNGCRSPKMDVSGEGRRGILIVGEAPGCVGGNTLIDTAFRDKSKHPDGIPIKDLVGKNGFFVYSYDLENEKLALGKVLRVWKTGRKQVFRVTYKWHGFSNDEGERKEYLGSILVTRDHKFLLRRRTRKNPFNGIEYTDRYLSIEGGLSIGHSIQPMNRSAITTGRSSLRRSVISTGGMKKPATEAAFLVGWVEGRSLDRREQAHHKDKNPLNDEFDNLELLSVEDHARVHAIEDNPMYSELGRTNHKKAVDSKEYREKQSNMMSEHLADPENRKKRLEQIEKQRDSTSKTVKELHKTPLYKYRFLKGRQKVLGWSNEEVERRFKSHFPDEQFPPEQPGDNHIVTAIEYVGEIDVFDMEVEKYHNFAANGVFVHNSTEDQQGEPFVGESGQLLRREAERCGVNLSRDAWLTNSIVCRPEDNATPTDPQIEYCRPNLLKTIRDKNPKVIVLLGASAVRSLIGHHWKEKPGAMARWVGWQIPLVSLNTWICPTWHPAATLRDESGVTGVWFRRHLEAALELSERPHVDPPDYDSEVEVVFEPREAAKRLRRYVKEGGPVSIDFETNMLKPESAEAEIVSCAVCWRGKETISYPWLAEAREASAELFDSEQPKIAANMKFEQRWAMADLGEPIRNLSWDTVLAAHVLDNRRGITSVKFQAFVQLGFGPYNEAIEPYLKSEGSNTKNRIRELDLRQLLHYGSLDARVEYEIAKKQRKEFK